MMQLYHYIIDVLSYWKQEYPDNDLGDSVFEIYENKDLKNLIKNCFDKKYSVPNCCGEINNYKNK